MRLDQFMNDYMERIARGEVQLPCGVGIDLLLALAKRHDYHVTIGQQGRRLPVEGTLCVPTAHRSRLRYCSAWHPVISLTSQDSQRLLAFHDA
jgi:hypothetical protein